MKIILQVNLLIWASKHNRWQDQDRCERGVCPGTKVLGMQPSSHETDCSCGLAGLWQPPCLVAGRTSIRSWEQLLNSLTVIGYPSGCMLVVLTSTTTAQVLLTRSIPYPLFARFSVCWLGRHSFTRRLGRAVLPLTALCSRTCQVITPTSAKVRKILRSLYRNRSSRSALWYVREQYTVFYSLSSQLSDYQHCRSPEVLFFIVGTRPNYDF